jgi:hypothetical protein
MSLKDNLLYHVKRTFLKKKLERIRRRDDDVSIQQFDEYRCIFVHIPKTAGISVAKSLLGKRIGHITALDYRAIFGKDDFEAYFKFAYVRNPYTRLVSAYEFMQEGGYGEPDKDIVAVVNSYDNFDDFVLNHLDIGYAKSVRHFRPQYLFICDSTNQLLVDFIGKFERIREDYDEIRKKIGRGEELKKMNVTHKAKKRNLNKYFQNPAVVKKIKQLYAKDFELFNYSTEIEEL